MILASLSGSCLFMFIVIVICTLVQNHRKKVKSGYYTSEAKKHRARLRELKLEQQAYEQKKSTSRGYMVTYRLSQTETVAKMLCKVSTLCSDQRKHEKALASEPGHEEELGKSREEFERKIKQIEQDVNKSIAQEEEKLDALKEYSYAWSETMAKIGLANEYIEHVHREYDNYMKKRPKAADVSKNAGQVDDMYDFKTSADPHEYFSAQERALLDDIAAKEDRLKTTCDLLEALRTQESIKKQKVALSDLRLRYRDFCGGRQS